MVPYAAFHYPVISLLVVAAIVLLVCLATPVITFMQNVKQSVVERLRQKLNICDENREIILPVFQISQVREISAHYSVETACVSDISVRFAC